MEPNEAPEWANRHYRENCPAENDGEPCDLCMTVQEAWEERQAEYGDWLRDCEKDREVCGE